MASTLVCQDVMQWAESTPPRGAHAMLCDPPYHLSGGFMGAHWDKDGSDAIAFRAETWAALARHLLPGAFVMAFASSRGYHRLACAMEDAGLIIHPSIFVWTYGSGFPKATKIDDERFDGHRYGMQALKPGAEPVICAQVPYAGAPQACIARTGAGSLWIDGGRIGTVPRTTHADGNYRSAAHGPTLDERLPLGSYPAAGKRWPPNLALCHTPLCTPLGTRQVPGTHGSNDRSGTRFGGGNASLHTPDYAAPDGTEVMAAWDCAENCPVSRLDGQAGERPAGGFLTGGVYADIGYNGHGTTRQPFAGYQDSGPASRFFHVSDWSLDVAETARPG